MTTDWRIERVGGRYWLTWCGWRQGSFPTLHDAVCEGQMRRRMNQPKPQAGVGVVGQAIFFVLLALATLAAVLVYAPRADAIPGCVPGAHRGYTPTYGEETVQSIHALGTKPIWLDLDAALTASPGYLVGMHDARTGRISAGPERGRPEDLTIGQLRSINLIWPHVHIQTVREMLTAAKATGANVLLDMKRWSAYHARWYTPDPNDVDGFSTLRDQIVETGMAGHAYVGGQGPDRTQFHALYPGIRLFIRTYSDDPQPMTAQWVTDRIGSTGFVGLNVTDRNAALVSQLHAAGVQVGTTQVLASRTDLRQAAWDAGITIIQSSGRGGCWGLT